MRNETSKKAFVTENNLFFLRERSAGNLFIKGVVFEHKSGWVARESSEEDEEVLLNRREKERTKEQKYPLPSFNSKL